jgi:aspartate ammonia-lyase
MPGKVNPVLAEMLNMVCYHVIGNDTTVAMASQAGQLELNVMMPVIAHDLLESLTVFRNALDAFSEKCVRGITADAEVCCEYAENPSRSSPPSTRTLVTRARRRSRKRC